MVDSYWIEEAKKLPMGKTARIECCKSDKSMMISHNSRSYSAYCFRCGFKDYRAHDKKTIHQLVKEQQEASFLDSPNIVLPEDCVPIIEGTDTAKQWLLQYGVSLDEAKEYLIGYSPQMDRVVLPVYATHGNLIYCQARALDGRQPKYLNQRACSNRAVFWANGTYKQKHCVITEDILSTIKIGMIAPACCILGTNMTAEKAMQIANKYDQIILWLDDDDAGFRCRTQARKQLLMQGVTSIKHICTPLDPKEYTLDEIAVKLKG